VSWLPSRHCPPLPYQSIDWKVRALVGKAELTRIWEGLWQQGVAAGRAEGIVGTMLVVLALAVAILILHQLRSER
jgi:hypothetical protein